MAEGILGIVEKCKKFIDILDTNLKQGKQRTDE